MQLQPHGQNGVCTLGAALWSNSRGAASVGLLNEKGLSTQR